MRHIASHEGVQACSVGAREGVYIARALANTSESGAVQAGRARLR